MVPNSSNGEYNINEEVVKLCPLCNSPVRYFFIDFSEKLLMCKNIYCEFPFGYEDLEVIILDSEINSDTDETSSHNNELTPPTATSIAPLPKEEKLINVCNSEESQVLNLNIAPQNAKGRKTHEHIRNEKEITKNVQDLKSLTMELKEMDDDTDEIEVIKNEKWIKKLMKLEGLSGVKLVKKKEMESLKQDTPVFGGGELKIDIDTNQNNMSSINIQILNKDDALTTSKDVN